MMNEPYVVKTARVLHRDNSNVTVEIFTDDDYEIALNKGDEFITVGIQRNLTTSG